MNSSTVIDIVPAVKAIKTAILKSRYLAAKLANAEMLKLYYAIGGYVSAHSRAGTWGTGAIESISERLSKEMPGLRGFSPQSIKNMRQFFEEWSDKPIRQSAISECQRIGDVEIRQSVISELSLMDAGAFQAIGFTHHMAILRACKTVDERLYYIRRCAAEFWPVRALAQHLKSDDYATQGHAVTNFEGTLPDDRQVNRAIQAFKSEYLLDFVNIVDAEDDEATLDEPEWMMEMVSKIRSLIQALGPDFCFMDVKKRFVVDGEEHFADLVFFHRGLRCMVAIELKRGKFKPAYLGQLEFYLACLDKYVKHDDENPSIGLILCHEMKKSVVEMTIRRHSTPLGVATYRSSADVPKEYELLKPLLDGAQRLLDETKPEGES